MHYFRYYTESERIRETSIDNVTREKGGRLRGIRVRPSALWLAGGTGPKISGGSVAFVVNRANDECKAIRAYHALDCGIFLDGKVDNLV